MVIYDSYWHWHMVTLYLFAVFYVAIDIIEVYNRTLNVAYWITTFGMCFFQKNALQYLLEYYL